MCMFSTYNLHDIHQCVIAVNGYCEKNWVATLGSGKPKLRIYEFIFFFPSCICAVGVTNYGNVASCRLMCVKLQESCVYVI